MQHKKEVNLLLAEAFKQLVLIKPIEKITIKEITDRAGVIRVTFYNHFQDKYELLEWICREDIVNPISILIKGGMRRQALAFIFNNILKNREFYSKAVRLEGQNSFESIIEQCFADVISEYLAERGGDLKLPPYHWLTKERIADYYANSLTYVLVSWIKSGMSETAEEMVEMYTYVTGHSPVDL